MGSIRYNEIAERIGWSSEQQAHYRDGRLHAVLEHAITNVPFYEKCLRAHGLTPRDIRHLKDLTVLPLTSQADFEGEHEAFLARGTQPGTCVSRYRGGTNDRTLHIYLSPEECQTVRAIERRTIESGGLTGRYSSVAILPPNQTPPLPDWRERLFHGRRRYVSSFETVHEQLRILLQTRPDCIASSLWILSRLAGEIRRSQPLGFAPRFLLSWGEPMRTRDRETLHQAFGVAPTDMYPIWEFGPIAAECPRRNGLHVNFDLGYVEILRDKHPAEPGEVGEVVITSLVNFTMPLIRYRVGDVASWKNGPCSCGWQGPVLEGVHGRLDQAVLLPTGAYVGARQIEECLDQFTNVVGYRAIQTEPRMVELLVVPGTLFQERTAQLAREKCLELFNHKVGVELRVVYELPLLTSPRRHSVICKLPHG